MSRYIDFRIFIPVFFLLFSLTCLSPDKSKTEIEVNRDKLMLSAKLNNTYELDGLKINLIIFDESRGFFHDLISSMTVDKADSAFDYLLNNYHVAYISIENTARKKISFNINSIRLVINNAEFKPIVRENLPVKLKRFNMKGTAKNIYNAGVITAVTSFVVIAIVACAKNNKCGGIDHIDDVVRIGQLGETDPDKIFSSFIHRTEIQYEGIIDKEQTIGPGKKLEGIVFFDKQSNILNSIVRVFYNRQKKIELKKII